MMLRCSCALLHPHGDGDQLIKIIVRETKGPRGPDRPGAVSGRDPNLDSPWPRRGRRRDKSQVGGAAAGGDLGLTWGDFPPTFALGSRNQARSANFDCADFAFAD
jgi:hypothetical protein